MPDFNGLCKALSGLDIMRDFPMREMTSFRIGGPAAVICRPRSAREVRQAIAAAKEYGVDYLVLGNCTNVLVRDGGINSLVIHTGQNMTAVKCSGRCISAEAGASLLGIVRTSFEHGLQGLEWASGIPGTAGGAVAMNAGAYGGEIKHVLTRIEAVVEDKCEIIEVEPGDLGYRSSRFAFPDCIVCCAVFELAPDDGNARLRQQEFLRLRREKQPLNFPSAGSVFKRPEGNYAGTLIERAGLKGASVGGAQVSELHAGFIINRGDATAKDVLELMELVRRRVYEHSGVMLQPEIKIIGED